jgi:hypothetical protein
MPGAVGADNLIEQGTIIVRDPATPAFSLVTGESVGVQPLPYEPVIEDQKSDPLAGVLESFEQEVKATGVKYEAGKNSGGSIACYTPFLYAPGQGKPTFMNTMFVDEEGRDPEAVKVSKRHEGLHALYWNKSAAAHASPYNMAAPIVLCPRDWGRLMRHSERAAMTYNAMLGHADPDAKIKEAMKTEPGTAEDFQKALEAANGDPDAALNRLAREVLNRNSNFYMLPTGKRAEKEPLTLRNYYTWYSLLRFEDSNTFQWDYELSDMPAPIFVRLDEQDILEMGEMLGFSAFGGERPDSYFEQQDPLMWKHQRWQQSMNLKMGILSSDSLPTLREALRDYFGKTPEEFVEFSRNFKQGDEPLQQIKPIEVTTIPTNVPLYN